MGFMAAAIPIATAVLGAMSKDKEQAPQQAAPPPPSLGQVFAQNWGQNNQTFQSPVAGQAPPIKVGGNF